MFFFRLGMALALKYRYVWGIFKSSDIKFPAIIFDSHNMSQVMEKLGIWKPWWAGLLRAVNHCQVWRGQTVPMRTGKNNRWEMRRDSDSTSGFEGLPSPVTHSHIFKQRWCIVLTLLPLGLGVPMGRLPTRPSDQKITYWSPKTWPSPANLERDSKPELLQENIHLNRWIQLEIMLYINM